NSEWLVVEACEWNAHFLHLTPFITVITNVEPDHLDYYRDIDHIVETFQELVNKTKDTVVINADDAQSKRLSISKSASFTANDPEVPPLLVPGQFNRANAAAALGVVRTLGGDVQKAAQALAQYRGAWRRFEVLGEFNGATIVSDYGHHPTAVSGTIQAAREACPGRRIVVAFHPHHQNRTKTLFNEFVESFDGADVIVINEIFRVPGREQFKDEEISSQQLVDAIRARGKEAEYSPDLAHTDAWLRAHLKAGDVALIMGAGDIYKVAEKLV
ncbi:MAG: cyanophycin synthetase, partial [bacterium]|nr:cyanophycin synthetase [bacterium]